MTAICGAVIAAWNGLRPDLQVALITSVATFLAASIGFLAIVMQIGRQAKAAIEQQRQSEIMKIKLRIYEDVVQICDKVTNVEVRYSNFILSACGTLRNFRTQWAQGIKLPPPDVRFLTFVDHQSATHLAAIDVIVTVERWEVVDPRLVLFQTAVNVALHDISNAHIAFSRKLMVVLPVDHVQTGATLPWTPPSVEELNELDDLAKPLTRALSLLGSFIHDFRIEAQRTMIGDLFGHEPTVREPIDPYYVSVRLDRYKPLLHYFETETAWGRLKVESEARARAEASK